MSSGNVLPMSPVHTLHSALCIVHSAFCPLHSAIPTCHPDDVIVDCHWMTIENDLPDTSESIPHWLSAVPVDLVIRIDVGLEGNWSETVEPVWSRSVGFIGFQKVARSHPQHRPAVELYLADGWIGIPCFRVSDGQNVLDEAKARLLIDYVASRQGRA